MNSALERILSLRVGDVMSRDVVSVSANETMADAARTLTQHRISGAPVVDEQGHCVGMLTGFDFAGRDRARDECGRLPPRDDEFALVDEGSGQSLHIQQVGVDCVSQHMSTAVQSIDAHATIINAARSMCAEHVHHLVVLDDTAHPVGMITTLDVVAALIAAVEE